MGASLLDAKCESAPYKLIMSVESTLMPSYSAMTSATKINTSSVNLVLLSRKIFVQPHRMNITTTPASDLESLEVNLVNPHAGDLHPTG